MAMTDEQKNVYRISGYTGRWGIIDKVKVNDVTYFLMENNIYGDETCYVVVTNESMGMGYIKSCDEYLPKFNIVVCETYDGLLQALLDEDIIDNIEDYENIE